MISDTLSDANWEIAGYLKDGFYRQSNLIEKIAVVSALMDELRAALDAGNDLKHGSTPLIEEFIDTHDMKPLIAALEWHVKEAR